MRESTQDAIQDTIRWLQPSMPQQTPHRTLLLLLRLALTEIRPILFLVATALALLAGIVASQLSTPLICTACAAPLPLLLLYFRYFWRNNSAMRELEQTFRFSFLQMYSARFVIFFGMATLTLLILSFMAALGRSAGFLRLALYGASSAVLLGGVLLCLSTRKWSDGGLGLVGFTLWMGLCVPMIAIPHMEELLATLPIWLCFIPLAIGGVLSTVHFWSLRGGPHLVCNQS